MVKNEIFFDVDAGIAARLRIYGAALSAVAEAVITLDTEARVVYLNRAAESMTGWQAAEAVGQLLPQVGEFVDQATGRRLSLDDLQGAGSRCVLIDRYGRECGIECRTVALEDEAGRPDGVILVCRDVSRRRAVEIALQNTSETLIANADALFEEKERAQVTLNSIGDAVISTDFRGRVSYLNIVAEKMTGWIQAEASGAELDDVFRLVDAADQRVIPCPTTQAIIEDRTVSLDSACVLVRRGGSHLAVEVSASPIHDRNGGVIGAVMVAHDVTAARELSHKLERLALHDVLTDLPNRTLFSERLTQAIDNARINGTLAALLYVDLDRFKYVNDSLGHAVGDGLLQGVARRLVGCVRNSDTVSRQGGDEFVVVLAGIARIKDAVACADKMLAALDAPFSVGEHELRVSASIGVAIFPDDASDADALLRCADLAMYRAKYDGRNTFKFFRAMVDSAPAGDSANG